MQSDSKPVGFPKRDFAPRKDYLIPNFSAHNCSNIFMRNSARILIDISAERKLCGETCCRICTLICARNVGKFQSKFVKIIDTIMCKENYIEISTGKEVLHIFLKDL